MTQLTLPFPGVIPADEDTASQIDSLVRTLLQQSVYAQMQHPSLRADRGKQSVVLDTILGLTQVNVQWETADEWVDTYRDIFEGQQSPEGPYQCCDHMERHANNHGEVTSEDYLIVDLDVSVWHNGAEIDQASLGSIALGWADHHGGPDMLYLAQCARDLVLEAF